MDVSLILSALLPDEQEAIPTVEAIIMSMKMRFINYLFNESLLMVSVGTVSLCMVSTGIVCLIVVSIIVESAAVSVLF